MNIIEYIAKNGYYNTLQKLAGEYSDQANLKQWEIGQGVGGGGQYNAPARMGAAPAASKPVVNKPVTNWIPKYTKDTMAHAGDFNNRQKGGAGTAWVNNFGKNLLSRAGDWNNPPQVGSAPAAGKRELTPTVSQNLQKLDAATPTLKAAINRPLPTYNGL